MRTCIFTTFNYQNSTDLIDKQSKEIGKIIDGTDIKFVPLRYNLPNKYLTARQTTDHAMPYLLNDFDIIIVVTIDSVPVSKEKIFDIIEKCKHGFIIIDGESFAFAKEHHSKLLNKESVFEEVFTMKVEV
jgi:hypothetical protein